MDVYFAQGWHRQKPHQNNIRCEMSATSHMGAMRSPKYERVGSGGSVPTTPLCSTFLAGHVVLASRHAWGSNWTSSYKRPLARRLGRRRHKSPSQHPSSTSCLEGMHKSPAQYSLLKEKLTSAWLLLDDVCCWRVRHSINRNDSISGEDRPRSNHTNGTQLPQRSKATGAVDSSRFP